MKRSKWLFLNFSSLSVHGDLQAVFDTDPPQSVLDQIEEDELEDAILENSFAATANKGLLSRELSPGSSVQKRRRFSSVWQE